LIYILRGLDVISKGSKRLLTTRNGAQVDNQLIKKNQSAN